MKENNEGLLFPNRPFVFIFCQKAKFREINLVRKDKAVVEEKRGQ